MDQQLKNKIKYLKRMDRLAKHSEIKVAKATNERERQRKKQAERDELHKEIKQSGPKNFNTEKVVLTDEMKKFDEFTKNIMGKELTEKDLAIFNHLRQIKTHRSKYHG